MKMAVLCIALCLYAYPAWALRCGSYLVRRGDHPYEVLSKCGEPAYVDHWVEYREVRFTSLGIERARVVPITVEEWIYDFGRSRFLQLLHFENGVLIYSYSLGLHR